MEKDFIPGRVYHKQFESARTLKSVKELSESDWSKIKALMPNPDEFNKDDIQVFTMNLANNQVDRDGERFSEEVLNSFAKTLPEKSFLIGHQWGPPGKGLFYDAAIKTIDGVQWLQGKFYVLKKYSESLIDHINAGIYKFVSIGFRAPAIKRIPADDDPSSTAYWEYRNKDDDEAEALEGSLVWLGAQYNAQVIKSLDPTLYKALKESIKKELENNEGKTMKNLVIKQLGIDLPVTTEKEIEIAEDVISQKIMDFKAESVQQSKFVEDVKGLFEGRDHVSIEDVKALKKTADRYREALVTDVIKFGTLIGMIKKDESEVEKEKEFYGGLETERLEKELERFKAKYNELHPGHSEIDDADEDLDGTDDAEMKEVEIAVG